MQVNTETIDEMLKDYKKPDDVLVENGLLKQLTKALLQYALNGQAPSDTVFRAAAEAAATAVDAMEDHQTTAEYRRDLVRAVVRRALEASAV